MKHPISIPLRMKGGIDPNFDREKIHAAGVERHRLAWLDANERAVMALTKYMDPSDETVREVVPLIVLRILDGVKFSRGLVWNKEAKKWKKRKE